MAADRTYARYEKFILQFSSRCASHVVDHQSIENVARCCRRLFDGARAVGCGAERSARRVGHRSTGPVPCLYISSPDIRQLPSRSSFRRRTGPDDDSLAEVHIMTWTGLDDVCRTGAAADNCSHRTHSDLSLVVDDKTFDSEITGSRQTT